MTRKQLALQCRVAAAEADNRQRFPALFALGLHEAQVHPVTFAKDVGYSPEYVKAWRRGEVPPKAETRRYALSQLAYRLEQLP